jgi:PAS domain S-box-containing protein
MNDDLKILLLEDNPYDAELSEMELKKLGFSYELRRVDTEEDFRREVEQGPDIILADYHLHGFDGIKALRLVREKCEDLPFIFVTGAMGEELAIEMLKSGATDYVLKDHLARLVPAVRRALKEFNERVERRLAEIDLQRMSRRNKLLLESAGEGIIGLDKTGRHIFVNPAAARMLGYSPQEMIGRESHPLWHHTRPDGSPFSDRECPVYETLKSGKVFKCEEDVFWRKDGTSFIVEYASNPVIENGIIVGCVVVFNDITQRKKSELELKRAARALKALSSCNQALVRAANEKELLKEVCNILVDTCGYRFVWIGFARETEEKEVEPVNYAGYENGYLKNVKVRWSDTPLGQGPVGTAIRTGLPSITRELATNPAFAPWREEALSRGYASILALPLLVGGKTIGSLAIYASDPDSFDSGEMELLLEMSDDLAYGIEALRTRQEHERAEAQVRKQLRHIRAQRNIDIAIISSLDLRLTLEVLMEQIKNLLGAGAVSVLLANPQTMALEFSTGQGFRGDAARARALGPESLPGKVAMERKPVVIADLDKQGMVCQIASQEDFHFYMAVPLISKGQVKGVLEVFKRTPFQPDPEWLKYLESLAGQAAIAIDNAGLFEDLQKSHDQLVLAYESTIEGWSRALDYRDKETEGHSRRVTRITVDIARAMGISESQLTHIRRGALLHDIGKLGVPDKVLFKAGKLDEEEWKLMKRHPEIAYELLSPISYLWEAIDIPYCHHEKMDGTGYPRGLKGEQIPLAARIFAVVDVWDALNSDRPYRPAWPREKILEHMRSLSGTHFDPRVLELFLSREW